MWSDLLALPFLAKCFFSVVLLNATCGNPHKNKVQHISSIQRFLSHTSIESFGRSPGTWNHGPGFHWWPTLAVVFVTMPVLYLCFHVLWCQASWCSGNLAFPISSSDSHDIRPQDGKVKEGSQRNGVMWTLRVVEVGGRKERTEVWGLALHGDDGGECIRFSKWVASVWALLRTTFDFSFFYGWGGKCDPILPHSTSSCVKQDFWLA